MSTITSLLNYKYYDTPEGTDVWKKTFVTSKYAGITGFAIATFDVKMYSHTRGVIQTLSRYAWYLGPMVGMAAGFTVTANAAQNFRGKNDKINYFLGGLVAGSVFGAWNRNPLVGAYVGFWLGIAGVVKKMGVDEGWTFLPEPVHLPQGPYVNKRDYTMFKELGPKYFTTNPEPSQGAATGEKVC